MHLKTRNVNTAFRELVNIFNGGHWQVYPKDHIPVRKTTSRNGNVLMIDEPVTVTYSHPRERVLFNSVRDANPFFHVVEALWMLAGRNDVALPAYYAKQMREYSDDGKTLNGAYGYRWRHHVHHKIADVSYNDEINIRTNQLDVLVNHLKADPNSRRAVLTMWNVEDDLLKIGPNRDDCPIEVASRDVCCNLNVMFSLREVTRQTVPTGKPSWDKNFEPMEYTVRELDMAVTNRSNDLLWGMLGANFVHFTFLQEYMAARLGVEMGQYHHITNNLHVYTDRPDWKPEALLRADNSHWGMTPETVTVPLVQDPLAFETDNKFFLLTQCGEERKTMGFYPTEPFICTVAGPMMSVYDFHKIGRTRDAIEVCKTIKADDWRIACTEWLKRRLPK